MAKSAGASASVQYYVHGRGRGHASRARDVIRALSQRGIAFDLFGGGDAADLLGAHPRWHARTGMRPGIFSAPTLGCHALRDAIAMAKQRPRVVISDGDQAALCAARLLGIPSVALGHDLALTLCELPREVRWQWRWHQSLNALPARVADRRIAVHFLPLRPLHPNVIVARPDCTQSQIEPALAPALPDEFVLCYFRDRNGAHAVQHLLASGARVVWFGSEARAAPGVAAFRFDAPLFRYALARCSAVVASAGSNLLAECVTLAKPVLALHRRRDPEQAINAELAASAGVADCAAFETLRAAQIVGFLARVRARAFATFDLSAALPPVSEAVANTIREWLPDRSGLA